MSDKCIHIFKNKTGMSKLKSKNKMLLSVKVVTEISAAHHLKVRKMPGSYYNYVALLSEKAAVTKLL